MLLNLELQHSDHSKGPETQYTGQYLFVDVSTFGTNTLPLKKQATGCEQVDDNKKKAYCRLVWNSLN
jgi:hypothetical protein